MREFYRVFAAVVVAFVCGSVMADGPPAAKIEFTEIPKAGAGSDSQGNIAGVVKGVEHPEQFKVVLYAHTDWWYVQPLTIEPLTDIASDGTWSNWTHLGYRYAALVVRSSFHADAKVKSLPHVGGDVIARGEVAASK